MEPIAALKQLTGWLVIPTLAFIGAVVSYHLARAGSLRGLIEAIYIAKKAREQISVSEFERAEAQLMQSTSAFAGFFIGAAVALGFGFEGALIGAAVFLIVLGPLVLQLIRKDPR